MVCFDILETGRKTKNPRTRSLAACLLRGLNYQNSFGWFLTITIVKCPPPPQKKKKKSYSSYEGPYIMPRDMKFRGINLAVSVDEQKKKRNVDRRMAVEMRKLSLACTHTKRMERISVYANTQQSFSMHACMHAYIHTYMYVSISIYIYLYLYLYPEHVIGGVDQGPFGFLYIEPGSGVRVSAC